MLGLERPHTVLQKLEFGPQHPWVTHDGLNSRSRGSDICCFYGQLHSHKHAHTCISVHTNNSKNKQSKTIFKEPSAASFSPILRAKEIKAEKNKS